jgi:hypothetical protein
VIAGVFELTRVDRWLYETLSGDEALVELVGANVYPEVAPAVLEPGGTLAATAVTFAVQAPGQDSRVLGTGPGSRALTRSEWTVKAVGPAPSPLDLEPVADRIDALIHGAAAELDVDGETWRLTATRTFPVRYPELVDRRLYRHLGGIYAVELT